MRATKKAVQASVPVLNAAIIEIVTLEQQIELLEARAKAERAKAKIVMETLGLERHASPEGHEALLIENDNLTWNIDKLAKDLDAKTFETLCPRKADSTKLREYFKHTIGLRKYASTKKSVKLEVRAPAATAGETKSDKVTSINQAVA